MQVRELINSFPGAAGYIPEAQRFGPSVSHQLVPDWQLADATRKAQRREGRREQMRFHTQRTEAVAASRQLKAEVRGVGFELSQQSPTCMPMCRS